MQTKVFDEVLSVKGNDNWSAIRKDGFSWPNLEKDKVLISEMRTAQKGTKFSVKGNRITIVDSNVTKEDLATFLEKVQKSDAFTKMHPTSKYAGKANSDAFSKMIEAIRNIGEKEEQGAGIGKSQKALNSISNNVKKCKSIIANVKKTSKNFRTEVNKLIDSTNAELDGLLKEASHSSNDNDGFYDALGEMVTSRKARIEEISNKLNEKHLNEKEEKADKKVDGLLTRLSKRIASKFRRNSSDDGE